MFAQRNTFNFKVGHEEKAVDLVKAEAERIGIKCRIHPPYSSPRSRVIIEFEWESMAAMRSCWAELFATPEGAAFWEELNTHIDPTVPHELWWLR